MTAPRLHFDASAAFVARTDFAHGSVGYKVGASFDKAGLSTFDLATLWRASLIDVAPTTHETAHAAAPVKPPKPTRTPRTAARS